MGRNLEGLIIDWNSKSIILNEQKLRPKIRKMLDDGIISEYNITLKSFNSVFREALEYKMKELPKYKVLFRYNVKPILMVYAK
jgi:hypothetical protein